MGWTNLQKQLAVRACTQAGISKDQRRDMILRNFDNAKLPSGEITSTSTKLTNADFEQFMAIVENYAGGQVLHFTRGYWQQHAGDRWARMRHRAMDMARQLEAAGKLAAGGVGLAGWISKRVTKGVTDQIEQLDYHQLLALIASLHAYARQSGVPLSQDKEPASKEV